MHSLLLLFIELFINARNGPYLTFLNIPQLKRQGADLETKIEELKDLNQVLREKDKMKEDVITNLSDKLIMLSERLDAIEKLKN
ncbi:MAG TPA: hypothetical protein VJU85_10135 [Nitrososphaeraceae archaeon]|nr:hypothetical protein [Nitrososphaeraceae archaeon]